MQAARAKWSPEVLEGLSDEDRKWAEDLLEDRHDVQPLREFITEHWPHEPPPDHIIPIIKLIERARHERIKVCLSLPPRHAKTVTILRGIVWWLMNEPADTCAYYSYSDTQARSKSAIARRWAREVGISIDSKDDEAWKRVERKLKLSKEQKSTNEWRTDKQGGVLAGGLQSGLTGQGVSGLFIVDDPFKNRKDADSIVVREAIWDNLNEVVFTRLEGASVIVVHTRWHEDDLIGRLSKDKSWEVINIPAIAEEYDPETNTPPDPLGREPGESLWEKRFPLSELLAIKKQIGDWSFASLYQGRPQPKGSSVFKEPARFVLPKNRDQWRDFLAGKFLVIGVDPAASEATHADYSVAVLMAKDRLGPEGSAWILDVVRKQATIPVFIRDLRALQARWKCLLAVEAVAGFKAVPQMLKHVDPNLRIVEVKVTTDKFMRAQPVAAAWNDARVFVPVGDESDLDWVDPYLQEMLSFTGVKDPNDDQVDGTAHGWNQMAQVVLRTPRGARQGRGAFGG